MKLSRNCDEQKTKSLTRGLIIKTSVWSAALFLCFGPLHMQCRPQTKESSRNQTVKVFRMAFAPTVTALGSVKPQVGAEVRLGARIPGKVERLRANVGDYVEKGQIIAELEQDDLKANVMKRQTELDIARINLSATKALGPIEIEKAEADWKRTKVSYDVEVLEHKRQLALFREGLISPQALDLAEEELLIAREVLKASGKALELIKEQIAKDLRQGQAEVESAQATLRIAEVEQSYAILKSPLSGIIASVSTQEGETVAVGLSAPTFVTIIDLDRLQVETYVDEVDIGKIKIGQRAVFSLEAYPAIDIEGQVVGIYPNAVLKENVVFYNVMVRTSEPPPVVLRPEMTANVSIFLESRGDVLAVPATAVLKSDGENFVYVIKDGKRERRRVQVGWKQGRYLEIKAGLQIGEEVLEDHRDLEGTNR